MSAENPLEELEQVIAAVDRRELPADAKFWAVNARETARGILDTVNSMMLSGKNAPTERQARALRNIYDAARRWLD